MSCFQCGYGGELWGAAQLENVLYPAAVLQKQALQPGRHAVRLKGGMPRTLHQRTVQVWLLFVHVGGVVMRVLSR